MVPSRTCFEASEVRIVFPLRKHVRPLVTAIVTVLLLPSMEPPVRCSFHEQLVCPFFKLGPTRTYPDLSEVLAPSCLD